MAHSVIFSPEAEAHLVSLYREIAHQKSAGIADRFTGSIVDYCEGFKTSLLRGRRRDDIRPGLRIVGFRRRATIAFVVDDKSVIILGVFYRGKNYESELRDASKT
ncbi:MAG: type II toxin-antitoxin system RelE/ParE family toxin [Micropepsaceae bacterium]